MIYHIYMYLIISYRKDGLTSVEWMNGNIWPAIFRFTYDNSKPHYMILWNERDVEQLSIQNGHDIAGCINSEALYSIQKPVSMKIVPTILSNVWDWIGSERQIHLLQYIPNTSGRNLARYLALNHFDEKSNPHLKESVGDARVPHVG